jgi:hypothetical protein
VWRLANLNEFKPSHIFELIRRPSRAQLISSSRPYHITDQIAGYRITENRGKPLKKKDKERENREVLFQHISFFLEHAGELRIIILSREKV